MLHQLFLLALLASSAPPALGHRILCVFSVPSRSHNTLGKGIVTALLAAGHEVTWVTPYPDPRPVKNLRQIDVSFLQRQIPSVNMMDQIESQRGMGIQFVKEMARNITLATLAAPEVRSVLVKEQFDAVFTEWFFSDVLAGLASIQQCPWLLLSGMVMNPNIEYLVDAVSSPAVMPMMMNDFTIPMGFLERIQNTLFVGFVAGVTHFVDVPQTEKLYHELFEPLAKERGVALRPFRDALHDIAVVFSNSHPAIASAQAMPPNVVEVAGYHLDEITPPLPEDLQKLLDGSPQGVIYFSMGSVLKSTQLPEETRSSLLAVFAALPYTVLWKFEEDIAGLPRNVHVRPWMPQQSILAHKNVRLFITHGGMLSSVEAIHFGVPLLAIPMFGDQPSNAARAARRGYARVVPYSRGMVPEVKEALDDMLGDDRYYKMAKSLSRWFRNRPVPTSQLIAYYTKLAIESGGAHHLRSKALLYPWYQRMLLDQLAALAALLLVIYFLLRTLLRACCGSGKKETTTAKKGGKVKKN